MKNKITLVEKEKEIALDENNSLKRKVISKEKENVSKKKKNNDSHSHHAFHATINKNEIQVLKNRINCLSSTLSNCAFNHSKLETLFSKKQAPHVHAHHPRNTYAYFAHHDHTHSHVHSRVYKCTHCDCKGHLAKFCYDKINSINFANKNV